MITDKFVDSVIRSINCGIAKIFFAFLVMASTFLVFLFNFLHLYYYAGVFVFITFTFVFIFLLLSTAEEKSRKEVRKIFREFCGKIKDE